jgi:ABC-type phosphate transport system auxiliary subunit
MTLANEPNDYDRQLRHINRRLERLEDTQVSPQEFSRAFDRVYEELGQIRSEIKEEFAAVNSRLDSLDAKFDIVMLYITGGSNPSS